jgi:hypothetical protein
MNIHFRHFPARRLTPAEHALVAEWLAVAGDVPSAFVSNRGSDDPSLVGRIVISVEPGQGPSHLIHASAGRDIWMMFVLAEKGRLRRFPSLVAALNFIRPVFKHAAVNVAPTLIHSGDGRTPST